MSKLTDFFPQQSTSTTSTLDVNGLNASVYADIILVAGGGGGSTSTPSPLIIQGGGAGGYFRGRYGLSTGVEYPVVVGAGGAAAPTNIVSPTSYGGNGGNTIFDNKIIAYGGGGSGSFCLCNPVPSYLNCALSTGGGHGGVAGSSFVPSQPIQYQNRFGCHSNSSNTYSTINGLSLDFTGYCALCPGACFKASCSNTGTGGCINAIGSGTTGGSGFAVISYQSTFAGAATTTPGAIDCSPQTPGHYTYVYTSTGSFTL